MLSINRETLLEVCGGRLLDISGHKLHSKGVCHDNREVRGGELFIALQGEKTHGHMHIELALSQGASLIVTEEEIFRENPLSVDLNRIILVKDSLKAYWSLASWWRKKCATRVLALTGSVGKTTVKDLMSTILLQHSNGLYSEKSFNNHTGVPLTLCRLSPEHNWAVIELGMNHRHELDALSGLVEPDAVEVLCIAEAHIGNLGSLDAVAQAKLEIIEGLKEEGIIILNGDDEVLAKNFYRLSPIPQQKCILFASKQKTVFNKIATVIYSNIVSKGLAGIEFKMNHIDDDTLNEVNLALKVPGTHNAQNVVAAWLGAKTLVPELTFHHLKSGLDKFLNPDLRMGVVETSSGTAIINDCYNANPRSMAALLDLAIELKKEGKNLGFILGEMKEMGSFAKSVHIDLGNRLKEIMPSYCVYKGDFDEEVLTHLAPKQTFTVSEATRLEEVVSFCLQFKVDVILVKASRSVGLEVISSALFEALDS
jgi:UDP-N-acetylmuramoyl-tripeptide--D-alanyl-D-alanine ligase